MSAQKFYLDKEEVCEAVALSESTVEKLVRENEFPKPRMLSGRRVAWLVREVEEWAEARPVSELLPPKNTSGRKVSASSPAPRAGH
ncbi:Prophage CP4-57 regulatory protein (AlpA) [compost metagenome]